MGGATLCYEVNENGVDRCVQNEMALKSAKYHAVCLWFFKDMDSQMQFFLGPPIYTLHNMFALSLYVFYCIYYR